MCDGRVYVFKHGGAGWAQFNAWLADETKEKACCDSKEIIKTALCMGVEARGIIDDVAIAAYLVDAGSSNYSVKTISADYLPQAYAQECKAIAELVPVLRTRLNEHEQIKLYEEMELPLARTLAKMELAGIKPDVALLEKLTKEMASQIAALEILAVEQAGESKAGAAGHQKDQNRLFHGRIGIGAASQRASAGADCFGTPQADQAAQHLSGRLAPID